MARMNTKTAQQAATNHPAKRQTQRPVQRPRITPRNIEQGKGGYAKFRSADGWSLVLFGRQRQAMERLVKARIEDHTAAKSAIPKNSSSSVYGLARRGVALGRRERSIPVEEAHKRDTACDYVLLEDWTHVAEVYRTEIEAMAVPERGVEIEERDAREPQLASGNAGDYDIFEPLNSIKGRALGKRLQQRNRELLKEPERIALGVFERGAA